MKWFEMVHLKMVGASTRSTRWVRRKVFLSHSLPFRTTENRGFTQLGIFYKKFLNRFFGHRTINSDLHYIYIK